MIKLNNASKIFKNGEEDFYALKDVCMEIKGGDFVAVCGPSGSGKTTLLNIIGCLDSLSSGEYILSDEGLIKDPIRIEAVSGNHTAFIRNKVFGFVLQDFALIESQTVIYNVELPLLFSKVPYGKIKGMALDALGNVGLKDQAKKAVNQLSGGQKQRVAIARALVNSPSIILADEPTGQLDSATGMQIVELLKEINSAGKTVIIVTHDQKVAAAADRIVYMQDGRILEGGK